MSIEKPGIEQPKEVEKTREDEIQEGQILTEAELLKGGADIEQGILKPSREQIEDIRLEMQKKILETQKEEGEYSQEQEEKILTAAQEAGKLSATKLSKEGLSDEKILELSEMKVINPEKFESLFNSKVDWNNINEWIDYHKSIDPDAYIKEAGNMKEMTGDEFDRHFQIPEKVFDKVLKRSNGTLLNKFWSRGMFGRDFDLVWALEGLADLKIINQEKFNDGFKINDVSRSKIQREINNLLNKGDKNIPGDRVGRMRVKRGARILGLAEERKEQ